MTKEKLVRAATKLLIGYGQIVKVAIFDNKRTHSMITKPSELDQDDVETEDYDDIDIFSPEVEPSNTPVATDRPADSIVKKYKYPRKFYCLMSTTYTDIVEGDGGAKQSEVTGDLVTIIDQLRSAKLPLNKEEWVGAKITYTELGKKITKTVSRVEPHSRWQGEPMGFDIYFEG